MYLAASFRLKHPSFFNFVAYASAIFYTAYASVIYSFIDENLRRIIINIYLP